MVNSKIKPVRTKKSVTVVKVDDPDATLVPKTSSGTRSLMKTSFSGMLRNKNDKKHEKMTEAKCDSDSTKTPTTRMTAKQMMQEIPTMLQSWKKDFIEEIVTRLCSMDIGSPTLTSIPIKVYPTNKPYSCECEKSCQEYNRKQWELEHKVIEAARGLSYDAFSTANPSYYHQMKEQLTAQNERQSDENKLPSSKAGTSSSNVYSRRRVLEGRLRDSSLQKSTYAPAVNTFTVKFTLTVTKPNRDFKASLPRIPLLLHKRFETCSRSRRNLG